MRTIYRATVTLSVCIGAAAIAAGQSGNALHGWAGPDVLFCSPGPCVLPPTQVSFGSNNVFDAPVVADPANPDNLIVGSDDFNCSQGGLGFQLTNDAGSNWNTVCMMPFSSGQQQYGPDGDPILGYDRKGAAYIGGFYIDDNERSTFGFEGFEKSSDGGNTWSQPRLAAQVTLIYPLPNTQHTGVQNTPAIAVDNSNGAHAGNLYVVMYNWTGTYIQVQVVRSTDGGNTWSAPVPVAPGITHDQFFPWISVGPTGLVGVSWLDRRNDPADIDYQAFAAISADGGLSFQPNVELTSAFSNPEVGGALSMGNYTGDTWDGPNYFIAAWMDSSNGVNFQDVVGGIRLK